LKFEISREDFVARLGRHRLWFFHPSVEGVQKLEEIGTMADQKPVLYAGHESKLTDAYAEFVNSFVHAVSELDPSTFRPFIFASAEDQGWLETTLGTSESR